MYHLGIGKYPALLLVAMKNTDKTSWGGKGLFDLQVLVHLWGKPWQEQK